MIFSFFCQKNRFDVNQKLQVYFEHEMAIFDDKEQSQVQDSVVLDKNQLEHPDEPLNKFKVLLYFIIF